jgi:hypothetical protein
MDEKGHEVNKPAEYAVVLHRDKGLGESVLQRTDDESLARGYFEGYARTYQGNGQRGELLLRGEPSGEILERRVLRG